MLKIHQSFAAVNAKVTVSSLSVIYLLLLQSGLVSKSYLHQYSSNSEGKTLTSTLNSDPSTLIQKMDLLALEDSRVLLALRYREQLNKRSEMGSLFDDIQGGD